MKYVFEIRRPDGTLFRVIDDRKWPSFGGDYEIIGEVFGANADMSGGIVIPHAHKCPGRSIADYIRSIVTPEIKREIGSPLPIDEAAPWL